MFHLDQFFDNRFFFVTKLRTAVSDNRISNDNSGEIVLGIKKLAISVNGKPTTQEREQKFKMQAPPPQIKLSDSMKNGMITLMF